MYKSIVCNNRYQVCKFLENMSNLGYDVVTEVVSISQDGGTYTIFYEFDKKLGEPNCYE